MNGRLGGYWRSHLRQTMCVPEPRREVMSNWSIRRLTVPRPVPRVAAVEKRSPIACSTSVMPGPLSWGLNLQTDTPTIGQRRQG